MITNRFPEAATVGQSIVFCQWLTSMPSSFVGSGAGSAAGPSAARRGG